MPERLVGITVLPEFLQVEGVDAVLDNLVMKAGANAVTTSPYVMEAADERTGVREPPDDAGAGGVRLLDRPLWGKRELFVRTRPSGRVDLTRRGNSVEMATRGVAALTLLISPDAFDLAQPIKVVVNGRPAFDGRVEASLPTLLKWAARDNDRTMLFAVELHITP